jgi:hypothetical protein
MRTSKGDGYMLSNSLLVTSSATFKGDAHFEGDTFGVVSEGIDLTGSTYIDGTLQVTSNVTFDSNLYVVGDVNIEGNINVTGVFNTTSVTQLHAEDKIIQLSTHSNLETQNENSVSDGAGVLIQGVLAPNILMSGFDGRYDTLELLNSSNNKIIDKSLTWNNNGGVEKMGMLLYDPTTDAPNLEPYWEMRGGGLRITQQVYNDAADAFVDVSFALRINAREELEILKCVASNDTSDSRLVALFGAQGHLGRGAALPFLVSSISPINLSSMHLNTIGSSKTAGFGRFVMSNDILVGVPQWRDVGGSSESIGSYKIHTFSTDRFQLPLYVECMIRAIADGDATLVLSTRSNPPTRITPGSMIEEELLLPVDANLVFWGTGNANKFYSLGLDGSREQSSDGNFRNTDNERVYDVTDPRFRDTLRNGLGVNDNNNYDSNDFQKFSLFIDDEKIIFYQNDDEKFIYSNNYIQEEFSVGVFVWEGGEFKELNTSKVDQSVLASG